MIRVPCEFMATNVIPVVRRELALQLIEHGFSQRKVAQLMKLTPSAVSQYIHSKRGTPKINGYEIVLNEIKKLLQAFLTNEKQALNGADFCRLCVSLRKNKTFLELNKELIVKTFHCEFEDMI